MADDSKNRIEHPSRCVQGILTLMYWVLREHLPHCFDRGGLFDFDKFKQELTNNEINLYKESYGMDWLGKSYARLLASDDAKTFLQEDESHNNEEINRNSENLLIKGDNLEVLKHLSNAYHEKIKMIYIDPPYNTGSEGFVYQDDRKFTVKELQNLANLDEETAKRILNFTQSKSNSHSAWLTFMYPRLYIARHLLKDDGVIFVSIDDNEVAQLRLLTGLIKILMEISCDVNDLILDFFAGSGTTADAVMQLNAEDGGNRKFILVQLPEPIDPKKNKTAYDFVKNELGVTHPTIFDICKERIIISAKKIQSEENEKNKQFELGAKESKPQDFGFKIFETIPNNEGTWENYHFELEELEKQEIFPEASILSEGIRSFCRCREND